MKSINDYYVLNDGNKIPLIGYGTFRVGENATVDIIKNAIKVGYRFFDTAAIYETERALGEAIKTSGIDRKEFFIATKLWNTEQGYESTIKSIEDSLERLDMDYVDLYLIHWPKETEEATDWKERNIASWKAMEEMHKKGKIKSLGLSNFLPHHVENILNNCTIKPVIDQLELHPGYTQEAAVNYLREKNILPMAWSPLGRAREHALLGNEYLRIMAEKYDKTIAQINLRYLIQKDILPIPKAGSLEHMKQNLEIFDFEISEEDMWILTCMPQNAWLGEHPDFKIPKKVLNTNQ